MTSTLFSRGGTSPWTTLPIPYDQTPSTDHCLVDLCYYYLSSDYLMSLDTAHNPILIVGPFITTIIIIIIIIIGLYLLSLTKLDFWLGGGNYIREKIENKISKNID